MARPRLEVADVFRAHGAAWRKANAGHMSLAQLKVMSAIETCRTAALGGHVERCEDCAHERALDLGDESRRHAGVAGRRVQLLVSERTRVIMRTFLCHWKLRHP